MKTMTQEEMQREQAILMVANLMRTNPFQVDFVVKKKPAGIRIVYEVTQEEMDIISLHYDQAETN